MAFIIPNTGDAGFTAQAQVDAIDLSILAAAYNGNGVIKGVGSECAVTAQGSPNMTLAVAAGAVIASGTMVNVASGNVTITTADSTNPRFDLVVVDNAGTKSVTAGTAAASPVFPAIPSNSVVLATVYVPASDTAINTNQITDKRLLINPYGTISRLGAAVTLVSSTAETALINWTVLGGLMGTQRSLRLTLHGDTINNSGSNTTLAIKVSFGGTVVWVDTGSTIATSASRRPFWIEVMISNQNSASVQFVTGFMLHGTAGGATTGLGDAAAAGLREVVFSGAGTGSINTGSDANVTVYATHGNSASTIDIRVQHAILELL